MPDFHDPHEADEDPQCVCGVFLSEHAMMGCPEGFQTPEQWERERQSIYDEVAREDEGPGADPRDDDGCTCGYTSYREYPGAALQHERVPDEDCPVHWEEDGFDEPDPDDDFPMSLEYDGLYGAPDHMVEMAAQQEAEHEASFFGEE